MATRFLLFMASGTSGLGGLGSGWLRSLDSNQGPSGYEPDELPLLHSARKSIPGAQRAFGEADGDGEGDGDGLASAVTR